MQLILKWFGKKDLHGWRILVKGTWESIALLASLEVCQFSK